MTTSRPRSAQPSRSPGIQDEDLAAVLHGAAREAMGDLGAVAAAVHLLSGDGARLELALAGGGPPSLFMVPGRVRLDSTGSCARALASRGAAVSALAGTGHEHALPHPYAALSVPLAVEDRRFG